MDQHMRFKYLSHMSLSFKMKEFELKMQKNNTTNFDSFFILISTLNN